MIRVATWNVEKATPKSKKGRRIQQIIKQIDADIFVLTEGCKELMPEGFVIEGGADWGYEPKPKCLRKVLLWSKYPLLNESLAEVAGMPPGRFVSAIVQHPEVEFRIFGVCIPWKDAHVSSGRKDRVVWQEHITYLDGLQQLIEQVQSPLVVAGDFNQRIPRVNQPHKVSDKLSQCIDGLQVCTALNLAKPLIDHIAISPHFSSSNIEIIDDHDSFGNLSDHLGVVGVLEANNF
jgi:endonuclease/exonuclease/phosphatase family metal-dependent hydrolase